MIKCLEKSGRTEDEAVAAAEVCGDLPRLPGSAGP